MPPIDLPGLLQWSFAIVDSPFTVAGAAAASRLRRPSPHSLFIPRHADASRNTVATDARR